MPADTPTFRYDPDLAPGYYVQAATVFLRAPNVSPLAKVLYLVLCSHAGAGETAFPGQKKLSQECAVSVGTLHKAQTELEALGLLTVTRRGLTQTNLYHLHKLPVLKAESQTLRIRNRKPRAPRIPPFAHKVESPELESGEGNPPQIQAPTADEVQTRYLTDAFRPLKPK